MREICQRGAPQSHHITQTRHRRRWRLVILRNAAAQVPTANARRRAYREARYMLFGASAVEAATICRPCRQPCRFILTHARRPAPDATIRSRHRNAAKPPRIAERSSLAATPRRLPRWERRCLRSNSADDSRRHAAVCRSWQKFMRRARSTC